MGRDDPGPVLQNEAISKKRYRLPGKISVPNPTTSIDNASVVKICNATNSLACF
jgi:hypothetical protein